MSRAYTSGKYARAMCDRCGIEIKYLDLKEEWTGLQVCKDCWDPKTGQIFPTNFPVDPEALYKPRPDLDVESGQGSIRIEPLVGQTFKSHKLTVALGEVTVTVV